MKMMNKKGQADIVGNVLSIIPKPVLFLLFIFFLGVIVYLLSPVFNTFGTFCDSNEEVVRVKDSNVFTNIGLLSSLPDAREIAGESIDPDRYLIKCTESINGTTRFLNNGCSDCDIIEGYTPTIDKTSDLCIRDAYRTSNDDLSWFNREVNCPLSDCRIPEGYYYESDIGKYACLGDCSSQTLAQLRDSKLNELGATPLNPNIEKDNSFEGIMQLGCTKSLRVEPRIKGIPIFRMEYWAMLILIGLLLIGIIRFAKK